MLPSALCLALLVSSIAADELKVTQYEGPTECSDADKVLHAEQ